MKKDPLMVEIVRSDFQGLKKIINRIEVDLREERIGHLTPEHFEAIHGFLDEKRHFITSYHTVKKAEEWMKKLEWLRRRYLWLELCDNVIKLSGELDPYLPEGQKDRVPCVLEWFGNYLAQLEFEGPREIG